MLTLPSNLLDAFDQDGFVVVRGVFQTEEVNQMRAAFDRTHKQALALATDRGVGADVRALDHDGARVTYDVAGEPTVRHIAWVGALDETLNRFGCDSRLLLIAGTLLGSDSMQQLIHQAHFKRPSSTVAFDWHQDSRHRGMGRGLFNDLNGRGSYVQIALALDDVTEASGPLQLIRGSHRLGHIDDGQIDEAHIDTSNIVAPLLSAGDVVAFSPYIIHGSQPNRSPNWRRVFINGFATPGASRKQFTLRDEGRLLHLPG